MYQIYFILYCHCTRFGRSFRPSSAVQDCTHSNHTDTADCVLASRQQYLFGCCVYSLRLLMMVGVTVRNSHSVFISVINQIDAQNVCFTISLFDASTCFEHMCSSLGGQNCITQPLVSSHLQEAVWCTG